MSGPATCNGAARTKAPALPYSWRATSRTKALGPASMSTDRKWSSTNGKERLSIEGRPLRLTRGPFEQRDAAPAHLPCDRVAEKLHDPRQIDLDADDIVQHFDPAGDPLPHCRRDKVHGVPFPMVIEPAEKSAQLETQAADAAIEPAPRL